MDAMAASIQQSHMTHESAVEHSTSPCCDAITPCSFGGDILVPRPSTTTSYGGSKRVASLAPTVQHIYLKTLSPPPKV